MAFAECAVGNGLLKGASRQEKQAFWKELIEAWSVNFPKIAQ